MISCSSIRTVFLSFAVEFLRFKIDESSLLLLLLNGLGYFELVSFSTKIGFSAPFLRCLRASKFGLLPISLSDPDPAFIILTNIKWVHTTLMMSYSERS